MTKLPNHLTPDVADCVSLRCVEGYCEKLVIVEDHDDQKLTDRHVAYWNALCLSPTTPLSTHF